MASLAVHTLPAEPPPNVATLQAGSSTVATIPPCRPLAPSREAVCHILRRLPEGFATTATQVHGSELAAVEAGMLGQPKALSLAALRTMPGLSLSACLQQSQAHRSSLQASSQTQRPITRKPFWRRAAADAAKKKKHKSANEDGKEDGTAATALALLRSEGGMSDSATDAEEEAGQHPLRKTAPVRRAYTKGCKDGLDVTGADGPARKELRARMFAKTSNKSRRSLRSWWPARARPRGLQPYPLTPAKLELASALLLKGGYRSSANYLRVMRREHIARHYRWTALLAQMSKDCHRALNRGKGPDRRADPLPLELLAEVDTMAVEAARTTRWPAAGLMGAVIQCGWLTREIESSSATVDAVTITEGAAGDCGLATWDLPVSKADPEAKGKLRSLPCYCPDRLCPVAAMRHVLEVSRATKKLQDPLDAVADDAWPLLPKSSGQPLTKADVSSFYKDLCLLVGKGDAWAPPHAARVTGATRMALAGFSEAKIQTFGRWGSAAVLRYVRDALLGSRGELMRPPGMSCPLEELEAAVAKKVPARSPLVARTVTKKALDDYFAAEVAPKMEKQRAELIELIGQLACLKEDMGTANIEDLPLAVQCRGGKVHIPITEELSHCCWPWKERAGIPLVDVWEIPAAGSEEAALWCSRCLAIFHEFSQ